MAAPVESSRFWTTGGAGDGSATYTRDQLAEVFRSAFLSDPTTQGPFSGLAVSGTASPLTLATGAACVYGYLHFCTTGGDLAVATPSVGTTGGHVVVRVNWTAQTVRAFAVRNTDGVNSTPALTQTAGTIWEIRLATFTITTGGVIVVTDARAFAHFAQMVATANLDNLAVTNAKLAADSVDDTKAGDRMPQFYRRQGGHATNWATQGVTTYTPGAVRMQAGTVRWTGASANNGAVAVTFPVVFSGTPICLVTNNGANGQLYDLEVSATAGIGNDTMTIWWKLGTSVTALDFFWLAIGPE